MCDVAISERPRTSRLRPATARQGRRPAELAHRSYSCKRDLLGKALPFGNGRVARQSYYEEAFVKSQLVEVSRFSVTF